MPQTSPERAARWPGMDHEAIACLELAGFKLGRDWCWRKEGDPDMTERETDAVLYLIEEWDFGGYVKSSLPEGM